MKTLPTLVRRELWEHRALYLAPLGVTAFMLLAAIVAGDMQFARDLDPEVGRERARLFSFFSLQIFVTLFSITGAVICFYLLDCLYSDRRDRSILFWKSLPVSDTRTVLAKLFTALVIIPIGVYALGIATDLVMRLVVLARLNIAGAPGAFPVWNGEAWLRTQVYVFLSLVVTMLWYLPLAGYLLVVSSWVPRSPVLWAVLPVLVAFLLERSTFSTENIEDFIIRRLVPPGGGRAITSPEVWMGSELWVGVVVGVLLVYAAIRVRAGRDDTQGG